MVSETAYENSGHWLLFLFEVTRPVDHSELAFVEFDEGRLNGSNRTRSRRSPSPTPIDVSSGRCRSLIAEASSECTSIADRSRSNRLWNRKCFPDPDQRPAARRASPASAWADASVSLDDQSGDRPVLLGLRCIHPEGRSIRTPSTVDTRASDRNVMGLERGHGFIQLLAASEPSSMMVCLIMA